MPASYQELVQTYDKDISVHLELSELVGAGVSSDPWVDALMAERDAIWSYYVNNGGWESVLHDDGKPVDPHKTATGRPVLRRGSKGENGRELQTLLGIDPNSSKGQNMATVKAYH